MTTPTPHSLVEIALNSKKPPVIFRDLLVFHTSAIVNSSKQTHVLESAICLSKMNVCANTFGLCFAWALWIWLLLYFSKPTVQTICLNYQLQSYLATIFWYCYIIVTYLVSGLCWNQWHRRMMFPSKLSIQLFDWSKETDSYLWIESIVSFACAIICRYIWPPSFVICVPLLTIIPSNMTWFFIDRSKLIFNVFHWIVKSFSSTTVNWRLPLCLVSLWDHNVTIPYGSEHSWRWGTHFLLLAIPTLESVWR